MMSLLRAKQAAANQAAEWVQSGMIIGLGSGSTATCFIEALILKRKQGLQFSAVASSQSSAQIAIAGGIEILDLKSVSYLDITVDGADEIDLQKRMIKGKGGAHVREKILAASSKEMIVIVDETKQVTTLGKTPLPIEILPFGAFLTQKKLQQHGYTGKWRKSENNLFVTENGNFLLDIALPPKGDVEKIHAQILSIPGVVDTGFFFNLAGRVIIGYQDGNIKVLP